MTNSPILDLVPSEVIDTSDMPPIGRTATWPKAWAHLGWGLMEIGQQRRLDMPEREEYDDWVYRTQIALRRLVTIAKNAGLVPEDSNLFTRRDPEGKAIYYGRR